MLSIKGSISRKEILQLLVVGLSLCVCPWFFYQNAILAMGLPALLLYIIDKGSAIYAIPLLLFMYPNQFSNSANQEGYIFWSGLWAKLIVALFLVITFFRSYSINNFVSRNKYLSFTLLALLIISFGYYVWFDYNKYDYFQPIIGIVFSVIYFFCLLKQSINVRQVFRLFDVTFYILVTYGITEFFFQLSPYMWVYMIDIIDNTTLTLSDMRVKSLFGHPLTFVGFLTLYQVTLYIRFLLYKKVPLASFLLLVLMSVISFSRTLIVTEVLCFFMFLFFSRKKLKVKYYTMFFALFIGVIMITLYAFPDEIEMAMERIQDSVGSPQNRLSAFLVPERVLEKYPLGIGENWSSIIRHIDVPSGFTVMVLDNSFLSLITSYGIFVLIAPYTYFYPFIKTVKLLRHSENINGWIYCKMIVLLTIAISFSFMLYYYNSLYAFAITNLSLCIHLCQRKDRLHSGSVTM